MSKFEELLCNLTEVDIILGGPAHDAMVAYVTGLEAENARLREEIDAIGKARHKDVVTLGGLYLENKSLKEENARLRVQNDLFTTRNLALIEEVIALRIKIDKLRDALADIAHGPVGYWNEPQNSLGLVKYLVEKATKALQPPEVE